MAERTRVAIVDDHPMMREGVAVTLEAEGDIEVVARGSCAEQAVRIAEEHLPDIMVLDINMPGCGLKAAQVISARCPAVKIIMLTVLEDQETVSAALRGGARGYVLKGISGPELVATVRTVQQGGSYVSPALAARLLADFKRDDGAARASGRFDQLTMREEQILAFVAQSLSNKEIGNRLGLSEKTVKHYMTNILQKLQAKNRVEAALMAKSRSDKA